MTRAPASRSGKVNWNTGGFLAPGSVCAVGKLAAPGHGHAVPAAWMPGEPRCLWKWSQVCSMCGMTAPFQTHCTMFIICATADNAPLGCTRLL